MISKTMLATLAFDTYCESTRDPHTEWEDLTEEEKQAWKNVGVSLYDAIAEELEEGGIDAEFQDSLFDDLLGDDEDEDY